MSSIRFLVNSRLVIKFLRESKLIHTFAAVRGISSLNPCIVQGSTVCNTLCMLCIIYKYILKNWICNTLYIVISITYII